MRRLLRRRVVVSALAIALLAAFAGAWLYTKSDAAKQSVQQELEERLGTTVRFDGLTVGLTGTTISDVRIHERDAGAESEPFVSIRDVDLDISAFGAVLDRDVKSVRLHDAHVLLRFDRQGNLLTKFPSRNGGDGELPTVRIESGTLTIRQEGRADSVFHGIHLTISPDSEGLAIAGHVKDADWGKWNASGVIPVATSGIARLSLRTAESHHVTPELLQRVPLVNPNAWTHVKLDGSTPAQFDLSIDMTTEAVAYRIALEPVQTSVEIANIGLKVSNASGSLVAEGSVVKLIDVRGHAADGAIQVDSRMDFGGENSVLTFHSRLSQMDVQKLPANWKLPPQIEGRLNGEVDLALTLPDSGGTKIEASGRATITDARLKGRPVPPIELKVGGDARSGLAFVDAKPSVVSTPPQLPPPTAAGPIELPGVKSRRPGLVSSALRLAARMTKQPDGPIEEREYLPIHIAFRDVDLSELLKAAGVEGSAPVTGKATVLLQVDIPSDAADDLKLYRMNGTITSPQLTIDQLIVEKVSGKLDMQDGKLAVRDLVGQLPGVPPNTGHGGTLTINGEIDAAKPYAFRATAKLDRGSLKHFEQLKNLIPTSMTVEGDVASQAELRGTFSPLTVLTSGKAQVQQLVAGSIAAKDLSFRWESDADLIRFKDATVKVFGGKLTGEFDVPLRDEVAAHGSAKIEDVDLGAVAQSLIAGSNIKLEGKANGTVTMRTPAASDGGSRGTTAEIDLQSSTIKLQGIQAKKIKGSGTLAAGIFKYSLTGASLGGQVEVSGQYPPEKKILPKTPTQKTDAGLDFGKLRVQRIRLSGLWDIIGLRTELGPLDAEVSGEFPLTTDSEGRLVGSGKLRADRLRWNDKELAATAQGIVRLNSKMFTLEDVTMFVGEGVARAHASFNRVDPDRSEANLSLTNVPSNRLLFLFPTLANRLDMNLDGRLTTTIGREWRGSGVVTASKGKVWGIPVTDVRAPIDWVISPARERGEVRVRDASATSSGGTMTARTEMSMFKDLPPRLAGDVQFRNANVAQAFRETGRTIGNLQITGKLEFSAEQYRSMIDLNGKFDAKLGESQPFNLPILSAIVPFLGVGRDYSTTIREGEVHAVLGRGVWKVQQVTLSGPSIDVYADGTVTLDGRLNGAVVARSGERPSQTIMRRFIPSGTSFASVTPANLTLGRSLLTDATSLIGNYVIYLDVSGTMDSPTVRVQALRTLSDAAIRFFLFRFITPIPT